MNKFLLSYSIVFTLAVTFFANTALAAEKNSTLVLGQNQNVQVQSKENKQKQDAQALFEKSLRQLMPLSDEQIQEYRTHSDKREKALLPISPDLNSRKWKSILHK